MVGAVVVIGTAAVVGAVVGAGDVAWGTSAGLMVSGLLKTGPAMPLFPVTTGAESSQAGRKSELSELRRR